MKEKFIKLYSNIALQVAQLSYCNRRKVGCIAVKEDRIISIGYNGTASGMYNICELPDGSTDPAVIHAEMNCISKIAQSHESAKDAILFVTTLPCIECAKLIVQSGIKDVYYLEEYRNIDGKKFLETCGIEVNKI